MSSLDFKRLDELRKYIQIVLITAVEEEGAAVRDAMAKGDMVGRIVSRKNRSYNIGYIGHYLVAHIETLIPTHPANADGVLRKSDKTGQAGAQMSNTIVAIIDDLRPGNLLQNKPLTFLLPGIAFGLKRSKSDKTKSKYAVVDKYLNHISRRLMSERVVAERNSHFDEDAATFRSQHGPDVDEVEIPHFLTPEEGTQKICDVLLSTQIKHGGHVAYRAGGECEDRSAIYQADRELVDRMLACHSDPEFSVHAGAIWSVDELHADFIQREKLRLKIEAERASSLLDDVVGGEMEGHAASAILETGDVKNVFVVKGICDWGVVKGDADHELAARNSVKFIQEFLASSELFGTKLRPAPREEIESSFSKVGALFTPPLRTLAAPTEHIVGRQTEIQDLRASLVNPDYLLTILSGKRGGGKSEILRQVLNLQSANLPGGIGQTFDGVIIVDFARAKNVINWYKDVDDYFNAYLGRMNRDGAVEGETPEAVLDRLIDNITEQPSDEYLLVFENSEDIIGEDDGSFSKQVLRLLLDRLLTADVGGLRILMLSSKPVDEIAPSLGFDGVQACVRQIPINPLSIDEGVELALNWTAGVGDGGLVAGSDEELRRFAGLAEGLPRLLITLCGMRRQNAGMALGAFVDDIERLFEDRAQQLQSEPKLSVLLNTQLSRFNDRGMHILTLLLAAARVGLTEAEIQPTYRNVCKIQKGKETLPGPMKVALGELQKYALAVRVDGAEGKRLWRLPNQITDAIELYEMSEKTSDPELVKAVYRNVANRFYDRIDAVQMSFQKGQGVVGGLRFEDEYFCENAAEWIRCLSHIDASEGRIHCLNFLLEAFNWFGQVVGSRAVEVILLSIERSNDQESFRCLYDNFAGLYGVYPKEPLREKPNADFSEEWICVLDYASKLLNMLDNDEAATAGDIMRRNAALERASYDENREQIQANEKFLYRIQANAGKSRSLLIFYRAEAISQLGDRYTGSESPVTLFEESMRMQSSSMVEDVENEETGVADLGWNVPFIQDALFSHFAKEGEWVRGLRAICNDDLAEFRDPLDREVEGRLFQNLSILFWNYSIFDRAVMAGFYATLQEYIALYTQQFVMDDYACEMYFMVCRRLFKFLRGLWIDCPDLAVELAGALRGQWVEVYNSGVPNAQDALLKGMMGPIIDLVGSSDDAVQARLAEALAGEAGWDVDPLYGLAAPELPLTGRRAPNSHKKSCNDAVMALEEKLEEELLDLIRQARLAVNRDPRMGIDT